MSFRSSSTLHPKQKVKIHLSITHGRVHVGENNNLLSFKGGNVAVNTVEGDSGNTLD